MLAKPSSSVEVAAARLTAEQAKGKAKTHLVHSLRHDAYDDYNETVSNGARPSLKLERNQFMHVEQAASATQKEESAQNESAQCGMGVDCGAGGEEAGSPGEEHNSLYADRPEARAPTPPDVGQRPTTPAVKRIDLKAVVKEGWLEVRFANGMWQDRWACLQEGVLFIFENESEDQQTSDWVVCAGSYTSWGNNIPGKSRRDGFIFRVTVSAQTIAFAAAEQKIANAWVSAIRTSKAKPMKSSTCDTRSCAAAWCC